jgi:hypothetical protein
MLCTDTKTDIDKTVVFPLVFHGCESWPVTFSEDCGLMAFKNRVLSGMLGTKKEEVTGGWTELYNVEHHTLYFSPNIFRVIKSRRMRWVGHVAHMVYKRYEYRIFIGKPEGRRPLGRSGNWWEDNIKVDLEEIQWEDVDWIYLAKDRDQW